MASTSSRILLVPAGDDDVPISLDELPSMEEDEWEVIISLLTGDSNQNPLNRPHSSLWTRMATEYFQTGRTDHALQLLLKGTLVLRGLDSASTLHSMLSTHFINLHTNSPKTILDNPKYQDLTNLKDKAYYLLDSQKHISTSVALAPRHPVSILSKGLLLLVQGKNDESLNLIENVLSSQSRHTLALFAKACILLRKRNYQQALIIYQQLLKLTISIDSKASKSLDSKSGWKGPDPRIGIGLCLLGLNRPSDAIRAWTRAATLRPNSSAPNLLLGLTALNTSKQLAPLIPGTYGYSQQEGQGEGVSEEEARERAYKHGIGHIQKAWKADNKNAMTAIILAEHIASRASTLSRDPQSDSKEVMKEFNRALKLCEHAIQYADSRAAFIQSSLIFARTSHLASNAAAVLASESMGDDSSGNDSMELRDQALKHYQKVIDESMSQIGGVSIGSNNSTSQQSMNLAGGGNALPNSLALAVLGLAQLQVSRSEDLAAINTLDLLLSKNFNSSSNYSISSLLEINILASSLRFISHPGASIKEKQSDFIKSKIGLEKTLRIVNSSCKEVYLRLGGKEGGVEALKFKVDMTEEEEEEEKNWELKRFSEGIENGFSSSVSRAISRTPLINEALSLKSFKEIGKLYDSSRVHVLMAQLFQKGQNLVDLNRAVEEWAEAGLKEATRIGVDLKNTGQVGAFKDKEMGTLVSCLINQNSLLVLKGLEEKPDWNPSASNDSANSTFSNPVRTEILSEAIKGLEFVLLLLSSIERDQPQGKSNNQMFSAISSSDPTHLDVEPLRTIVFYNLGRALEGLGEEIRAVKIYDDLLEKHPEYTDAKVRKAIIYLGGGSKSYSSKDGIPTSLLHTSNQGNSSNLISPWNRDLSNSLFKECLLSNPLSLSIRLAYVSFLSGTLPCSRSASWSIVKDILAEAFLGSNPQGVNLFGSTQNAKLLAEEARKDSFTLSALGWVYYNLALQAKPGPNARKDREKGMLRSADLFDKALIEDERNCFAAQGLAILLAEDAIGDATFNSINSGSLNPLPENEKTAKLNQVNQALLSKVKYLTTLTTDQRRKLGADESLMLLGKLRELKDSENVQICIGHANMMKEEFERAGKAFEQASSRYLCNSDPTVLQQLSRATYAQATRMASYELLETSLNHLRSALGLLEGRKEKSSSILQEMNYVKYNLAVISQKGLAMLYDKKPEQRDRGMIERAVKNVEEAQRIFESLAPIATAEKLAHISAEVLEQRSQYGSTSLLRIATRHLTDQTAYEARVASAREEVAAAKREKEARILEERRLKEEDIKEKARLLAEQRKRDKEEVGTWEYRKDLPEDGKKSRGAGGERKRTKKRDTAAEVDTDGEIDDDALFGPNKNEKDDEMNSSGGESEVNEENKQRKKDQRIKDLKRKKSDEKKKSKGGEKKQKKDRKNKKKGKPQFSDDEESRGEAKGEKSGDGESESESGSEDEAPKRKKSKKAISKKAAAQEDVIDSDEEI